MLPNTHTSYYWNPTRRDSTTTLPQPISIPSTPTGCSFSSLFVQDSYAIALEGCFDTLK